MFLYLKKRTMKALLFNLLLLLISVLSTQAVTAQDGLDIDLGQITLEKPKAVINLTKQKVGNRILNITINVRQGKITTVKLVDPITLKLIKVSRPKAPCGGGRCLTFQERDCWSITNGVCICMCGNFKKLYPEPL